MVSLTPDPLLFLHHFLGLYSAKSDQPSFEPVTAWTPPLVAMRKS